MLFWKGGGVRKATLANRFGNNSGIFKAGTEISFAYFGTGIIQGTLEFNRDIDGTTYPKDTVIRYYADGDLAGTNADNMFDDTWSGGILLEDTPFNVGSEGYVFKGEHILRRHANGEVKRATLANEVMHGRYFLKEEKEIFFYDTGIVKSATLKEDTDGFYEEDEGIHFWSNGNIRKGNLLDDFVYGIFTFKGER